VGHGGLKCVVEPRDAARVVPLTVGGWGFVTTPLCGFATPSDLRERWQRRGNSPGSRQKVRGGLVRAGSGKGTGPVLQEVPKTDSSVLTRPLPAFVVEALRAAMALPLDPGHDDPVFPNLKGAPRQPSGVRRELKTLTAGTEFETSHTHLFRKNAVTQTAREMGLEAASELAGHSDTRVTKSHHVAPASVAPDARAALDKLA